MRVRTAVAVVALVASCAKSGAPTSTEILWDTWGVPHIFARDNAGAFKAFGYAQAKAHANLILRLYGEARGRAAEYWGESELPSDRFVHLMGIPGIAAEWYQGQTPEYRGYLDAFAAGFNQYAAAHPAEIADSVKAVLPVSATDVLAHGIRIVNFLFMFFDQVELPKSLANGSGEAGSNMWAIGPKRSASGNALLLQNPHLPWDGLYLFLEGQIVTPDMNLSGATLVGMPTIAIGFNDYLGWSHTVNTQDGVDVYRLTKRGTGYLLDGREKPFETRLETIKVKLPDGTLRVDSLVAKRSVHGPIFDEDSKTALAVRVAGLDDPRASEAWWDMGRAKNLAEFEGTVKRIDVPFFNIIYADRDGHIYYFFGGRTPVRPAGDFQYWGGPVRGDSSSLIWTSTLPYEKLPHVTDPPSGWLQNANDPPWTVTWPLVFDPDSFPAYLAPRHMAFRPERSAAMAAGDSSITFDELIGYKHSSHMGLADRLLPELIAAARSIGDARARAAADVLEKWDRAANADSRGAVLFDFWAGDYLRSHGARAFAHPWRLDSALVTPSGLGDPSGAVRSLSQAAAKVEQDYGSADVPWGEVMRIRYAGRDLPGNGAPGDPLGVFRAAYYAPAKDGKFRLVAGDTYYAAVEFSRPIHAKVLLAYGNATQPGSKHVGDQLDLFVKQRMRDVWRDRATIEAHLESKDEIEP